MKKRLAICGLLMVLCAALAVPTAAAEGVGTNTYTRNGGTFTFSNPIISIEDVLVEGYQYNNDENNRSVPLVTVPAGTIVSGGNIIYSVMAGPVSDGVNPGTNDGGYGPELVIEEGMYYQITATPGFPYPYNIFYVCGATDAEQPIEPPDQQPEAVDETIAYATSYSILVDGQSVAYVLNGSQAQFNVGWDGTANAITITTGEPYASNGSEMSTPFSGDRTHSPNQANVLVDGQASDLEAITLVDDSGNGYTYFKLRDLGQAIGFNVTWDNNAKAIVIDSTQPYQS
ncbi:stalk domain-containing protein [Intestinimonas butyriciproducens]|uniref:stalk domain-containing protein n=1 Tax=Intestinimonas butyriciproducens TaxID=1297617 RepID=UPI00195E9641|nr:stalk domain-containing protein [Intestinimonas butyriciproducens]MBM6977342.1 hypothetical protein [Intestinimonas butyriciproducens]